MFGVDGIHSMIYHDDYNFSAVLFLSHGFHPPTVGSSDELQYRRLPEHRCAVILKTYSTCRESPT